MRRMLFLAAVCTVALAGLIGASVAMAGGGHFVGTPTCDIEGNLTRTASIFCSGKVAGFGNEPVEVFIVVRAPAGCRNPGNDDIPGQRNFVSEGFSPDANGNVLFGDEDTTPPQNTVEGTVSCHGGQEAFITSPVTLRVYTCTSGSPTFSRKTGLLTNNSCTLQDTASATLV
jgi:hypothetical protein